MKTQRNPFMLSTWHCSTNDPSKTIEFIGLRLRPKTIAYTFLLTDNSDPSKSELITKVDKSAQRWLKEWGAQRLFNIVQRELTASCGSGS